MKLENRDQKVVPLQRFIFRLGRYSFFAFGLVFISLVIVTLGYHYLGALTWLNSFHMACMILTGMGPMAEMKNTPSILFSSFSALDSGVAFLSITAVFFAPIIHRLLHILHVEHSKKLYKNDDES